jgi:hypothetical protein
MLPAQIAGSLDPCKPPGDDHAYSPLSSRLPDPKNQIDHKQDYAPATKLFWSLPDPRACDAWPFADITVQRENVTLTPIPPSARCVRQEQTRYADTPKLR